MALATRLKEFDTTDGLVAEPYEPTAYRATLIESGGVAANVIDWPWPEIKVGDFKKPAGEDFGFPRRAMSLEEMDALGVADPEGGVQGLSVEAPDGNVYSLAIRPLFPDETD
jgi:hypothetical protein